MGVNVAAHTRHIFLGSAPTPGITPAPQPLKMIFEWVYQNLSKMLQTLAANIIAPIIVKGTNGRQKT